MRKVLISVGTTLDPDVVATIDKLADKRNSSRSEIIRAALNLGLPSLRAGIAADTERLLAILEYNQLALSLIVQEQYPEDASHLLEQALSNVRAHHG
ncbi:MAG: CopG family transcriptional regulator [Erythrobacter sp.]|nr:CopG family transcriptional regulator [Erythrobacter sp.]